MIRQERTNAELQKQLAIILSDGIKDPRVQGCMVSILRVECDSDLTLARIFVSIYGADGREKEVIEGLNSAQGYIKSCLKNKIKLRALPQLKFIYDDSIVYSMKIEKIIKDLH
ncbi:MAG: 30S ribosome-binding factor RbfA [Clostridia bacterium]